MWPDVARTLTGWLLRSGFDRGTVEDAVQETAARVLIHDVEFKDAADLLRWARVVARNLAIDSSRRASFVVPGEIPDRAVDDDLEYVAEQRRRLDALPHAFESLSANDQRALRVTRVDTPGAIERKRQAVRLHRARARLLVLVEGLAAWTGWAMRPRPRSRAAVLVVPAAAVLIVAISFRTAPLVTPVAPVGPSVAVGPPAGTGAGATGTSAKHMNGSAPGALPSSAPPTTTTRMPYFEVAVPRGPGIEPILVGARPKTPEDHFACLDTIVAGYRCIDLIPGLNLGRPATP